MVLSLQRYTYSDLTSGLNRILKERSEKERERSMDVLIHLLRRLFLGLLRQSRER
ncbi:hypothetical protein Peur_062693 [Populus x canadensis]